MKNFEEKLRHSMCSILCSDVKIHRRKENLFMVQTPLTFPDGDPYQLYIIQLPNGIRVTDKGHTLMQISYETDVDSLRGGTRGRLFDQILAETDVKEGKGEFYYDSTFEQLGFSIFKLGQVITRLTGLNFLNRSRVENTFYQDFRERILEMIPSEIIKEDYYPEFIDNGKYYKVDFRVEGRSGIPLYIFAVPNKDKAMLSTITLEKLAQYNNDFESLIVFGEDHNIPRGDINRLLNAGGDVVTSLAAEHDLKRKIQKRISYSLRSC